MTFDGFVERSSLLKIGGWRDLRSQRKSSSDSLWWRDLKEVWTLDEWKYNFEETFSWRLGTKGR